MIRYILIISSFFGFFYHPVIFADNTGNTRKIFFSLEDALNNPTNVVVLDLSNKRISSLPPEIKKFKNLKELNLSSNFLSHLPDELCELTKLQDLNLSSNNITELPSNISKLKNLQILDLSYTKIFSLPASIGELKNLQILNLSFNKEISSLPQEIGKLENLRSIDISCTSISSLPSGLYNLTNLKDFIIARNDLTQIPQDVLALSQIKYLDLNENKISSVPPGIIGLKKLERLDLSDNMLETISSEIKYLDNLITLDLSDNKLVTLPAEIGELENLFSINLSNNQLISLPAEVGKLKNLKILNLSNNKLKTLPPEIGALQKLKELNINGNRGISIPDELLQLHLEEIDFIKEFQKKLNEFYFKQSQNKLIRNSFIIASSLLIIIIIFILWAYFSKRKANKKIRQTYEELKRTQQQLIQAEKLAALGNLVSRVAHEINTPVGVGVTTASSLVNIATGLDDKYKNNKMKKSDLELFIHDTIEASNLILKNMQNAYNLVKSFKRVSIDQVNDDRREFFFREYLQDIITSIQPKLNTKNIKVEIRCFNSIRLNSFPGIWSQIIINLALNSLIHGFKNATEGMLVITVEVTENELALIFADNGCGIDEKDLPKIFDPFFTTDKQSGTGLGLNIVYNLVTQKLNGMVTCKSKLGSETAFYIRVPVEFADS